MPHPKFQAEMLRSIIRFKASLHKKDTAWTLNTTGIEEVTNDFLLMYDYYFGSQQEDLDRFVNLYGPLFLSDSEKEQNAKLSNDEEKRKYLMEHAKPQMDPFWYFMVSLCRLLQSQECDFKPTEAYWLGLVDEVPGSGLPNLRQAVEAVAPPAAIPAPAT